jgi:alpha-mannosidase
MTIVHMIGNAHIDPVWLWNWQAGVDEALATVSSAADRCDEYPDFIVTRGEAWIYAQVERLRPALFARVRRLVEQGRWFIAGGVYVQPDLNLPTPIALERQIRRGQAYFQSRFGVRPRIGYHVDSFGHPAFLPDLLVAHSYVGYVFSRPEPRQMALPRPSIRWRGAGGAELPAFRIVNGYATLYTDLHDHVRAALDAADPALGHTMCFYGFGNHGGGPTKAQIEWIIAHRQAFNGAELRFSTPQAYFDAIAPFHDSLPLIQGEMQHTFPGCYSVMSDIKRAQRRGEHLLAQAEHAATAFSADAAERGSHGERIDAAWDDLLFTDFHDIVTGTSTPFAWESCRAMQGRARIMAEAVTLDATRGWAHRMLPPLDEHQIVLMNPDDAPFDGIIECETWLDYELWQDHWLSTPDHAPIPFQQVQPASMHRVPRLLFSARIAARGATTVLVQAGPPPTAAPVPSNLVVSATRIANQLLAVDLTPSGIGGIAALDHSLLAPPGIRLHLRQDHADTWAALTDRWAEPVSSVLDDGVWTVEETGPLRARVRMDARLGTSRLRWTVSLLRDDPRLFMQIEINFDERFTLLQMPIHLASAPRRRTDGVPGGAVERPLSPTEWPVQDWSRMSFDGVDMAVTTQDAFSLSVDGALWQWTLMRSPLMAWPGEGPPIDHGHVSHTDQGVHTMAFELHIGTALADATLDLAARRMAQRPITFDRFEGMNRPRSGVER